jgi:hypothetical protein
MAKPQPNQTKPPATQPKPQTPPKQELAERQEGAVAVQDDVPDYIKKGAGRGSENVEMQDVVIPRIEVVQALSKCLKESDPAYIDGAKQGDLYNTVTRRVYGPAVRVVPVFFSKMWLAWRDQKKGGGFAGAHATVAEAEKAIAAQEMPDDWEAVETAQNLLLVVHQEGTSEEAVVSMAKTKLKVSRNWNSLIRLNGNDRFSRMYVLHSVDETNTKNQDFKNYGVYSAGFPARDIYLRAESLYNALTSGARKMNVDTSDHEDVGGGAPRESGEY